MKRIQETEMKTFARMHGYGLATLLATTALASAHCMAPPDLGDGDLPTGGDSDDLGGGGVSTASANEGELLGGTSMAASDTIGDDGKNVLNGADDGSGGHQLDASAVDDNKTDLGLDPGGTAEQQLDPGNDQRKNLS